MASPPRTESTSALEELRDALDDAIRRAYCEPVIPVVEGEDAEMVRRLAALEIITSPIKMRHLAGVQAAAWEIVKERVG